MKRTKRAPPDRIWWVRHPEHGTAVVSAPNWELATVEAAKWWDVPWREAAALCECEKTAEAIRHVCVRCGRIFHGDGLRCALCQAEERDRILNKKSQERRFYRTMMPKKDGDH